MNSKLAIKFMCSKCKNDFTIESLHLSKKKTLCCPNCENIFPEDELHTIAESLHKIEQAKTNVEFGTNNWKILIFETGVQYIK